MKSWGHQYESLSPEDRVGALCSRCGRPATYRASMEYLREDVPVTRSENLCPAHQDAWVRRYIIGRPSA